MSSRQTKRASLGYGNIRDRKTGQGLMVAKQSVSVDEISSNSSCKSVLSSGTRNIGSIQLMSVLRHSNNSPATSIDGWSSESSSSTCSGAAKRRSGNLQDKLKTETIQASGLHQFTLRMMSADQHPEGALKDASSVPIEPLNTSKPSGLRMPSPKIGFFDEVRSVDQTTIDTMQFRFRSQNAVLDLNVNAVRKRPSKIQPLRYVPGTRNNIGSPLTPGLHCTSSTRPQRTMHSKQLDNALTKSTVMKNSLGQKLQTDTSFEVDNAYCSKTRKVGKGEADRKKIMLTASLKTEEKRNKGILKNKLGKEGKDQKAGRGILLETVDPVKKDQDSSRELHPICESKENFEDQVNGLSRYFEVIDLGGNAIELEARKSNAHEHNESVDGECFLSGQLQDSPSITRIPLVDKIIACDQPSPL